jgi:hypothetical protein
LTHFKGPFATTVAARGRSSSKAISPVKKRNKLSKKIFGELLASKATQICQIKSINIA